MKHPEISFVILTFNEELHLPRLLNSIKSLNAATFVLDSGSTDQTVHICFENDVLVKTHTFNNHPEQWHIALQSFPVCTPWVIGLDADQVVTTELLELLLKFKDADFKDVDGIYFNRKNYFKGNWIKHGGFYPRYMLKMFRYKVGYSDRSEDLHHHFQVPGKTQIWKKGHIIEENLKDNQIGCWIQKHNQYSDRLALEEVRRIQKITEIAVQAKLWGTPNEQIAFMKRLWWQFPKYTRPLLYFIFRMTVQRGILDGKTGIIYHFLQGFWFRLIVDIKIDEHHQRSRKPNNYSATRFCMNFLCIFSLLYFFTIFYIGITTPGRLYIPWLHAHLNYIGAWRDFYITSSAYILKLLGYQVDINHTQLMVKGHAGFKLIYSCLGYGVMSCFAAFAIAFPRPRLSRLLLLITGLLAIQTLNTVRLILIAIFYETNRNTCKIDHHDIFNYSLYLILSFLVYIWANKT